MSNCRCLRTWTAFLGEAKMFASAHLSSAVAASVTTATAVAAVPSNYEVVAYEVVARLQSLCKSVDVNYACELQFSL